MVVQYHGILILWVLPNVAQLQAVEGRKTLGSMHAAFLPQQLPLPRWPKPAPAKRHK